VWPRPPIPTARIAGALGVFGLAGAGVGAGMAVDRGAHAAIALGVATFGALLAVVAWLPGLAPVELHVDDARVYWHGERYGWDRVVGARADGGTLVLLGRDGAPLDTFPHLAPEVARWLALAIAASAPPAPGCSSPDT
jgi:hypothetical protein